MEKTIHDFQEAFHLANNAPILEFLYEVAHSLPSKSDPVISSDDGLEVFLTWDHKISVRIVVHNNTRYSVCIDGNILSFTEKNKALLAIRKAYALAYESPIIFVTLTKLRQRTSIPKDFETFVTEVAKRLPYDANPTISIQGDSGSLFWGSVLSICFNDGDIDVGYMNNQILDLVTFDANKEQEQALTHIVKMYTDNVTLLPQ
jgi:hypothetical protein